ncbi:MAG: hypothetical protein J6W36_09055, partial [Clostridiales bacterium]|nr:hypothetical protein [Clostridiales bacterium]
MSTPNNTKSEVISEKKINVVLGIIHIVIVLIIIGTNLYFRFTDARKGDSFEYVEGVIVKREEKYSYIGRRRTSDTWITVRYTPKEEERKREYIGTDFSYGFLYTGTRLRVYYKYDGSNPKDVYLARYDWLVKDYLPADKSYNIPLIVAGILLIIGIYYLADNKKPKKKNGKTASRSDFSV